MSSLRHIGLDERGRLDPYLDAARECILDVGWRRTTLTEVARRSGVSRMTIYRAWPDMPSLLGDLMTREWVAIARATQEATPEPTTPAGIAAAAVATVRALRENDLFVRIVELDPELLLPYLLARPGRSQLSLIGLLRDAVGAGQAAGTIRAADPEVLARSMVLAGHGLTLSAHTMVDDEIGLADLDEEFRRAVEVALEPRP